ncbi:DUF2510 domain-containing protein [Mycobacteroides abscessus]|nr:DUF2510 domain-containing protein [Mycobacteroides abscessus]
MESPGWYPDPSDPTKQIYWDGTGMERAGSARAV